MRLGDQSDDFAPAVETGETDISEIGAGDQVNMQLGVSVWGVPINDTLLCFIDMYTARNHYLTCRDLCTAMRLTKRKR